MGLVLPSAPAAPAAAQDQTAAPICDRDPVAMRGQPPRTEPDHIPGTGLGPTTRAGGHEPQGPTTRSAVHAGHKGTATPAMGVHIHGDRPQVCVPPAASGECVHDPRGQHGLGASDSPVAEHDRPVGVDPSVRPGPPVRRSLLRGELSVRPAVAQRTGRRWSDVQQQDRPGDEDQQSSDPHARTHAQS